MVVFMWPMVGVHKMAKVLVFHYINVVWLRFIVVKCVVGDNYGS